MLLNNPESADEQTPEVAAAAAVGSVGSIWARHGRAAIQESHTLSAPLARWTAEPVESPVDLSAGIAPAEAQLEIEIPQPVVQARPPLKLPEDATCRSPICGLVVAVMAEAGQPVKRHQPILVVEAMKMLNEVSPEVDGVLKTLHVAPGDAVKTGQILFELA